MDFWCVSLLLNGKYSSLTHCERYLIFLFFSDFFSDFPSKNAIDHENSFFFLIEMNCFNWNEMFFNSNNFSLIKWILFLIKTKCFLFKRKEL